METDEYPLITNNFQGLEVVYFGACRLGAKFLKLESRKEINKRGRRTPVAIFAPARLALFLASM